MDRTKLFIKNTIFNYIFKIIGIFLGFITIPITLTYLGDERFGIWQTMLSMISWAMMANFGIGNGLRNKVSECLASNDTSKLKANISSAYKKITIISVIIFCILILSILSINLNLIFKETKINTLEIRISFIIIIINFSINFVVGLANSIAYGIHKSYYITIQQTLISILNLILVAILNRKTTSNIINMAIVYTIINISSNIILSVIIFKKNSNLIPSTKYDENLVDKKMYKLGIKFFILQLASLILISTDNFLVSSLIGSSDVTYYSIVNKLFVTINTVYSILLIQLWNSTTDAYFREDYKWIIDSIKRLVLLLIPVIVVMIIIIFNFDLITKLWLGRDIIVDIKLVILMAIYILLMCWNGIFINIQNGIGDINIQIIAQIIAAILNIPCAIVLVKQFGLGMNGIVLANIISQLIIASLCPIHVMRLLIRKSKIRS